MVLNICEVWILFKKNMTKLFNFKINSFEWDEPSTFCDMASFIKFI